jgi:hypothetical protein
LLLVAGIAVMIVSAHAASAGVVMPATVVSPNPSPFAACDNQGLAGFNINAEVEPWLAVDPRNGNYAVAWQQDRWGDPAEGGAHGLVAWSSVNGKNSWAPFTTCSGGTAANNGNYDRASDVWLAYGADGRLYQAALVFNWFDGRNAITVSTSTDDGRTWGTPSVVASSPQKSFTHGFDKESVTADPTRPGVAYVVWDRYSNQLPDFRSGNGQNADKGPAYISTTTDGGKTWSSAKPMYTQGNGTLGNQLVVLSDGTLVDFFTNFTFVNGAIDPRDGASLLRAGDSLFDVALGPSGALYAVWEDSRFSGVDQVAFTKSIDGGNTWSTPVKIGKTPANANPLLTQAFTPSVDVSDNGTIAVTYYDFRGFAGGNVLPVTYSAITSTNGGSSWGSEINLSTSDEEFAPVAGGLMIGDYEGLAHSGNTFLTAFQVGNNASDPTDIAVASFTP